MRRILPAITFFSNTSSPIETFQKALLDILVNRLYCIPWTLEEETSFMQECDFGSNEQELDWFSYLRQYA